MCVVQPGAASCLVLGTESGRVLILNPAGNAVCGGVCLCGVFNVCVYVVVCVHIFLMETNA